MEILENKICEPFLNHIPPDNFVFSILEEDSTIFNHFIMNYYLDFYSIIYEKEKNINYRFTDTYMWNKFTELSHIFIPTEKIDSIEIENIISMLEDGYTILCCVNTSFIEAYHYYGTGNAKNISHEIMIYGADLENRKFLCKDYFNMFYEKQSVGFEEIIEAIHHYNLTGYKQNDTGLAAIKIWSGFTDKEFGFDKRKLKKAIENGTDNRLNIFLATEDYLKRFPYDYNINSVRVFFNFIHKNVCLFEKRAAILHQFKMLDTNTLDAITELGITLNKILMKNRNTFIKAEVELYYEKDGRRQIKLDRVRSDLLCLRDKFTNIVDLTMKF